MQFHRGKSEITDVRRAMGAIGPMPVDVGACVKGGKGGGKQQSAKGSGKITKETCRNCGKPGQFAKECWAPGGGAAAAKGGGGGGKQQGGKPRAARLQARAAASRRAARLQVRRCQRDIWARELRQH